MCDTLIIAIKKTLRKKFKIFYIHHPQSIIPWGYSLATCCIREILLEVYDKAVFPKLPHQTKAVTRRLSETPAKTITDPRNSPPAKHEGIPSPSEKESAKTDSDISNVFRLDFSYRIDRLSIKPVFLLMNFTMATSINTRNAKQ